MEPTERRRPAADVLVIGAGVIGLAIAWRCRQRGLSVTVVDPAPGSGASRTAAGMLAPVTELHYGEQSLLALNLASAARYPSFAAELQEVTGRSIGYRRSGTVVAAWDAADLAALRDLAGFAATLGQPVQTLTGRELRALVPGIAPGLPGGLLAPEDHQVDNRRLHGALLAAVAGSGAALIDAPVARIDLAGDRVNGVTLADGTALAAGTVVLAAGAHSGRIAGLPEGARPRVHPVKGQTVRLRMAVETMPPLILRGTVKGAPVYLVPRDPDGPASGDGAAPARPGVGPARGGRSGTAELVIGASSEEAGFDCTPRAGAVYELLRDAQSLLPAVSEAELVEVSTGLRPGSPDNAPLIGRTGIDGLVVATGHYRNGVLLTPITGDGVAALLADGDLPPALDAFQPERRAPQEVR
ncbi:FAD-dependent oxidoreductase [Nakamurella sp.]|uniref:FAD-dependent oxidoreductase n=1 Tax=Nakamurella sp. TaxID=1869182 RepID=UPI003B3AC203